MKTLTAVLANAAAALCVFGALWALAASIELSARVAAARGADQYQRDTLIVEKIAVDSSSSKGKSSYRCYAEGAVRSVQEQLSLSDCSGIGDQVVTREAAVGQRIEVLINRDLSPRGPAANRRTLRFRDDLKAYLWGRVTAMLPLAYGPLLISAAIALALGLVSRFVYARPAGFWCLWPVAIVLVLQGVALALVR